ncbi:MAG TPA: DUF1003 domain-containing protein, partial [Myxococcaceae bacterium]|nr:DUF1003 domain-containing protein [Myxococcaceae bacterium]
MSRKHPEPPRGHSEIAGIVHRNIQALLEVRQQFDRKRKWHERIVDTITSFVGSTKFLMSMVVLVAAWIVLNAGFIPGFQPFDPYPFVMLGMIASVMAIFLSTMV